MYGRMLLVAAGACAFLTIASAGSQGQPAQPRFASGGIQVVANRAVLSRGSFGARLVVFGSGTARAIPDGFPREQATEQLVTFLRLVAQVATANEIIIAIEPLNRKESNVINSVADGVALAAQVNRAPIRVLADFYHMDEENEPLAHISQYKNWLAHIHVADTGRLAPGTGRLPGARG